MSCFISQLLQFNTFLLVKKIEWIETELIAYNLTVGESYTYTVSEAQVWVHNSRKCGASKAEKQIDKEV